MCLLLAIVLATPEHPHRGRFGAVQGRLRDANFDTRRARLRSLLYGVVVVNFSDSQAEIISKLLGQACEARGVVHYNAATSRATFVDLEDAVSIRDLASESGIEDSWTTKSIDQWQENKV